MRRIFVALCLCAAAYGQAYAPVVTMNVRMPDGQMKELAAPESGLAKVTLNNGQEYAFRPTMWDDKGTKITVTIFKIGSPDAQLGEVETGVGKPPADSKTSPDFKIGIGKIAANQS